MKKNIVSLIPLFFAVLIMISCKEKKSPISKAEYSGKDLTNAASITRNKETKAVFFSIETQGKWSLYAGTSVDNIDFSKPVIEGTDSQQSIPLDLSATDSVRYYFQLVTEEGKAILAERLLPMAGGYNFRDLGGFKTKEGKYVKWGKIFRSDDLNNLTDSDLKYLANIPLVSIVDFRSEKEIKEAPDKLPSSVVKDYPLSITPGNLSSTDDIKNLTPVQIDSIMMAINTSFVTDSAYIEQYRTYFSLLQNEKDVPLMFHCSAGKDRTGMGAALVLFALGVDEETIFEDYLSSNRYLGNKYAKLIEENPNMKSLFQVKTEFLKAGIDQMKKDHGSVENYLTNVLNVDIPKMREMYLY